MEMLFQTKMLLIYSNANHWHIMWMTLSMYDKIYILYEQN